MRWNPGEVQAARLRLRGRLVDTPMVGGFRLPGRDVPTGLRVKVETLQVGGSLWSRGAMHWLARRRSPDPGLIAHGGFRRVVAGVAVAAAQRTPVVAIVHGAVGADARAWLRTAGAHDVHVVDTESALTERIRSVARETGFPALPEIGDEDHDLGIATLGLELAEQLPLDTAFVAIAPAELADLVGAGLVAAGRTWPIRTEGGGGRAGDEPLASALAWGLRVLCDGPSQRLLDAVLATMPGDGEGCVVLGA